PAGDDARRELVARQHAQQSEPGPEKLGRRRPADDRRDGLRVDHLVRHDRRGVPEGVRRAEGRAADEHERSAAAMNVRTSYAPRARSRGDRLRAWRLRIAMACLAIAPLLAQSQSTELHIRYNSGQGVAPIYEGWERVADGSFNMVFGYLNRNHVQQLALPIGTSNGFDPGPADRGQPTFFYPRENHFLFRVNVPKDWDRKKELVWTITANGKTEVARATLLDVWEIDRKVEVSNNGGVQITNELINRDAPPIVKIDPIVRPRAG